MVCDPEKWITPDAYGREEEATAPERLHAEKRLALIPDWKERVDRNIEAVKGVGGKAVRHLSGVFNSSKVVVVGAGPTAYECVGDIREAQRLGMKIVCVDRIHGFLKENDVFPDIVITLDYQEKTKKFLKDVDESDVVVVNMLQHPDTIDALIESGCELYAYVQSTPHGEQTKYCFNTYGLDYLCLRAFPSVGAQAFELAFHTLDIGIFSFGYIYMVGNELGWHSEEAARNGANSGTNQTLYKTELKDGRVFYSISCFIETEQMLSQIYHYIQRSTNIVVADCSDGLARLPKGTLKDLINIAKGVSYGEISEQMERQGDYCSGEYKLDIGVFGQGR